MLLRIFNRYSSTVAANHAKTFTYPQRIQRSSTALLEALNSCVEIDGGNPSYTFMDDPFLIPTSTHEKRQFALSKASGKKAARWIMDRYSFAFFNDVAIPSIPSYFPNYKFDEKEFIEPDETTLYKLMNWNQLVKAYEIYKKCLHEKIHISDSCTYALFDLLCINNSEDPVNGLLPEEDWYRRELNETNQSNLTKRTWKDNGFADQMFENMKTSGTLEQNIRLYNSYASGLFKHIHVEKALLIVDEMKQNNIPIDLTTYNYLIRSTSIIKESHDARWQFMMDYLQEMKQNSIRPNIRTFNALFYTLKRCTLFERGPTLALSLLNEMRQCGIQPSLGTWAHVIMIFYPNDQVGYDTQILPQIMDELEKQYKLNGNKIEWQDIDDGEFFSNAMFKATTNCRDIDLAKRIHRFLMMGSNSRFIPDGFKEQMYYTNLFRLLFHADTPERVIPLWESVVPNIYCPPITIIENFMEFISTWNISEHIIRLWSDLLMLGFVDNRQNNRRILERYLTIINHHDHEKLPHEQLKQHANIARQILKRFPLVTDEDEQEFENLNDDRQQDTDDETKKKPQFKQSLPKFQYSGHLLSNLICLLSHADDFETCWPLYQYYLSNKNTLFNPLNEKCLMTLLSLSLKQNRLDDSIHIVETINEHNYECLGDALDIINRNGNLDNQARQHLRALQKHSTVKSAHLVKLL